MDCAIHRVLPSELLLEIFKHIDDGYALWNAAQTCSLWKDIIENNDVLLWKRVCLILWFYEHHKLQQQNLSDQNAPPLLSSVDSDYSTSIEEEKVVISQPNYELEYGEDDLVLLFEKLPPKVIEHLPSVTTWKFVWVKSIEYKNNMVSLKEFLHNSRTQNGMSLSLHKMNLPVLPLSLFSLTHLVSLSLAGNKMRIVPHQISSLTNLQGLSLVDNRITELPPQLCLLSKLQGLFLSYNRLNHVQPQLLRSLTRLKDLYIDHNRIKELPSEIGTLTSLESLDLSHNRLADLPDEMANLVNLVGVNLKHNHIPHVRLLGLALNASLPNLLFYNVDYPSS